MKNLKITNVLAIFVMVFGLMITQNSCKDPCKDVTCLNSGTCDEGVCACTKGYEGDDCGTESRAKFLATYSVSGPYTCGVTPGGTISTTPMIVSASSTDVNKIVINVLNRTLTASLDGSAITIASQSITSGGVSYTYTGTGSFSGSNISLTLNEDDPSVPETCTYNLSGGKQ